jgi:hypothetical protein
MSLVRTKLVLLSALMVNALSCFSQANRNLENFFKNDIELTDSQIRDIRNGQAVAKTLRSRVPAEIFVFGAVYIQATPEAYVKLIRDFDRLRDTPGYLAIREFSDPPQPSDFEGFTFENEDIKSLKNCKPGDCQVQMPASSIENIQRSVERFISRRHLKRT